MTQESIEALLRKKIGLDATIIGSSTIARAVRQCMTDCGLSDLPTYLTRLQTSPQELEALIEKIIVPETWFFRDREPFNFLCRYAISEWLPTHPNGVLRVLSIPCSTGEEPYSIAIALLSAGLAPKNFHIDAIDISKKSLQKAERAIYEKNSFRSENSSLAFGKSYNLQEQYFVQTVDGYQVSEWVRQTVHFIQGNLLDPYFLMDKISYNVIFCRNLLIYFDQSAREKTIQLVDRLLTQKGLLFVGHSETGQLLASRFVSVRHPLAFAYRKKEEKQPEAKEQKVRKGGEVRRNGSTHSTLKEGLCSQLPTPPYQKSNILHSSNLSDRVSPITLTCTQSSLLETARNLANLGQLNDAATLCETYLSQNRVNAEAYFLLGEVHQAASNEEQAEQCFHKAIYLQPNHYEALTHLALLKERRGETASAAIIRQRIQRLQKF